ncbi:MAG: transcription antitermination factor NusB [Burkholderiales bacterium]|nr:transcription antitermination factor NusB [Burkholderiales bacterium]
MSASEPVAAPPPKPRSKPTSPRRRSRELAVQMLYGWLLSGADAEDLKRDARLDENFRRIDADLFDRLVDGVTGDAEALRARLQPYLDRTIRELSPVEHAILLLGALELAAHPETPYRVVINEAIDLAKTFGGTDGHKYVNGVLDRLAAELRPNEAKR